MRYYHGTTMNAAQQIKREGLKPNREAKSYNLMSETWFGPPIHLRDLPGENLPVVYVTTNSEMARGYAKFRTQYEMVGKGEAVVHEATGVEFRKLDPSCGCKETPAVVVFDLPEELTDQFHIDIQDFNAAFIHYGVIPPEYIVDIELLEE